MIWATILEQIDHQGHPEIEPFGILAWRNRKNSISGGDPRKKRRAPGEIRKICNQTVENHGLLGAGNRRFSMKIVGNSRVGVVSRRIL